MSLSSVDASAAAIEGKNNRGSNERKRAGDTKLERNGNSTEISKDKTGQHWHWTGQDGTRHTTPRPMVEDNARKCS